RSISRSRRWRETTSHRGANAERQCPTIVRCTAGTTTDAKVVTRSFAANSRRRLFIGFSVEEIEPLPQIFEVGRSSVSEHRSMTLRGEVWVLVRVALSPAHVALQEAFDFLRSSSSKTSSCSEKSLLLSSVESGETSRRTRLTRT